MSLPCWHTITERDWGAVYRSPYLDGSGSVIRVFPGANEYADVVRLRYHGLIETGFIDPGRMAMASMELPRDRDSIILALKREGKIIGTLTLNTITPDFPGLAMELDKGVALDHPHFRAADALEFTKLVVVPEARILKLTLNFMIISCLLARLLGKNHFWQVSRNVRSDILHRERLGFSYAHDFRFRDRSLNDMDSRVGYCHFPLITTNPRLLNSLRGVMQDLLSLPLPSGL